MPKLTYSRSGVHYGSIDPIKKLAQSAARSTARYLNSEVADTRGESAYVWKQGNVYMAAVIEGLGTKNLVADAMRKITGKTYYDAIAHDTVASIINDLATVGAKPLTVQAYWAVGNSHWLTDKKRMRDLINGWKNACALSGASWGGGETPALKGIIHPETIDLAGGAVGIIQNKKQLLLDKKIRAGDRILLLKSSGINMNGLTLARAIASTLPKGYATKLPSGKKYGEALLTKSNIYARLVQNLFKAGIDLHYIANITGHGLRKIMRGRPSFTYVIEKIFNPPEVFTYIQKHAKLSDEEMYQTFNMGQDYAIFLPANHVKKAQAIIRKNKFVSLDAGYVKRGEKQVIIEAKELVFKSKTLDLR